jgi:hypothetical protein
MTADFDRPGMGRRTAARTLAFPYHHRVLSGGVEDLEAIGFCRIASCNLDWRPSPLPYADARRAGQLDLSAGAFEGNLWPGFGKAPPVRAVCAQHVGDDGDRVTALKGHEGGRFRQPLAEGRLHT